MRGVVKKGGSLKCAITYTPPVNAKNEEEKLPLMVTDGEKTPATLICQAVMPGEAKAVFNQGINYINFGEVPIGIRRSYATGGAGQEYVRIKNPTKHTIVYQIENPHDTWVKIEKL